MERPSDWSAVGYASDPIPGDPVVVRQGALDYQRMADSIASCAQALRSLDAGGSRGSQAVAALLETRDDLLDKVGVAEGRYREAGGALEEYAGALDRAQSDSLNALAAAKSAQADAMEARTRAERMRASAEEYPADGDAGDDRARYMRLAGAADADEAAAQGRVAAQKEIIDHAVSERDIAAERAIEIINGACGDGLADSWWDDWGKAITQWIAKICEIVSGIAGVLALLVSWVPIVGQALAAFLGALSAVTGVIAALANTVLAMAGEQTWLDAVISVGFAALGCVGLGGLRGVAASARAMAGARGAWAAAGGLRGVGGLRGLASGYRAGAAASLKGAVHSLRSAAHNLRHDPQGVLASAVAALKFKGSGRTDLPKGLYEGRGKNHGSAAARAYEEQITGYPVEYSIYVEGDLSEVEFDGFRDGVLLEAKGPSIANILSHEWGEHQIYEYLEDMQKQLDAMARGGLDMPIHWHFAEEEAMNIMLGQRIPPGIRLFHTPPE